MAKAKRKTRKAGEPKEPLINRFAARHGDYREAVVVDLSGELGGGRQKLNKVVRNLYPSIVDRWLAEGGPGFEEPQRRAIDHCRALWIRAGTSGRLVANLDYVGGGTAGDGWSQQEALSELAAFQDRLPAHVWDVFVNVVRYDLPAGRAGSDLANNSAQQQAAAKACVGFAASMIAQWRMF